MVASSHDFQEHTRSLECEPWVFYSSFFFLRGRKVFKTPHCPKDFVNCSQQVHKTSKGKCYCGNILMFTAAVSSRSRLLAEGVPSLGQTCRNNCGESFSSDSVKGDPDRRDSKNHEARLTQKIDLR